MCCTAAICSAPAGRTTCRIAQCEQGACRVRHEPKAKRTAKYAGRGGAGRGSAPKRVSPYSLARLSCQAGPAPAPAFTAPAPSSLRSAASPAAACAAVHAPDVGRCTSAPVLTGSPGTRLATLLAWRSQQCSYKGTAPPCPCNHAVLPQQTTVSSDMSSRLK